MSSLGDRVGEWDDRSVLLRPGDLKHAKWGKLALIYVLGTAAIGGERTAGSADR